ncbi:uncharacterized protein LOC111496704 isoform X2 [Cucurbita maxima]|uniref:Uncharacterized protein LOC111496704 isoform X2 n=1 Tax=Cucurbita maxima TaxID=3661 RepID=A0A6J1KV36_CUCMA|nr:uncharacterized protein LOC111496704 isoform X2 [Cucurbita maxima]
MLRLIYNPERKHCKFPNSFSVFLCFLCFLCSYFLCLHQQIAQRIQDQNPVRIVSNLYSYLFIVRSSKQFTGRKNERRSTTTDSLESFSVLEALPVNSSRSSFLASCSSMESADNPKSVIPSGEVNNGVEKAVVPDKILISDQTNRFQYTTKPDSFIIDMDSFSNSTTKEISQSSSVSRNFSRKGTLRGGNKIGQDHGAANDTEESMSPIGGVVLGAASTLEKQAVVMGLGSMEEVGGGGNGSGGKERPSFRRISFKRSSQACSWYLDPRKIFMFCATLSCLGTMVLIYFAFSSGMLNGGESELELE